MSLNIAGTSRHIARDLRVDQKKLIRRATLTAMNRANSKVFTEAKREVRSKTGIPLKHFKKKIKKFPARFKSLRARVWMGLGSRLSLAKVNTGKKINKKWRNLVDEKSLDGSTLDNAFRANTRNGHQGIFVRTARAAGKSGRDAKGRLKRQRLPLSQVTLDISEQATLAILQAGRRFAKPEFEKNLRHEIRRRQRNIGTR